MSDSPQSQLILYRTPDGKTRIQCRFENENVWLTQALMAELFQVTVPTINEHLKGIFAEGELSASATIRKFLIVRSEGTRQVTREIEHYSLEVILAVGYRVKSAVATRFRIWATQRLREYIVKGFALEVWARFWPVRAIVQGVIAQLAWREKSLSRWQRTEVRVRRLPPNMAEILEA